MSCRILFSFSVSLSCRILFSFSMSLSCYVLPYPVQSHHVLVL
jgi:hypothetical protein